MSLIRFEDYELDLAAHELRRGGRPCAVEPQVFDLLVYLASNPARLVTKDELIEKVWGGRIVSDAALSSRIKSARRAIGDDGERQRLIRTVHRRGFRFVGEPVSLAQPSPAQDGSGTARRKSLSGRPSIAVLPLRPSGSDEIDRSLAETVTEEVVTCLARDRTLAVSTQGELVAADASAEQRAQLGQADGSRYLLEGSVRRAGDRLFVTARLTDALSREHIWAERCEQPLDTKLAVDDQTARMIAAMVRSEIEAAEARQASARPESERDAWAHYHLGLREMYRFTPAGLAAALACFERAVALDPEFASASARLAYAHIQNYWYGPADRRALALGHAKAAAMRAIGLDRKNALGHLALGRVHALRREFDLAMNAFETAIRLNPCLAQAYFALGQAHFYADRPKDAVRLLESAMELDPHDSHFWSFLHDQSDAYYALEELDEAARRAKAASRYPNATHWPLASLASVLGTAGRGEEARDTLCRLRARWPAYTLSSARMELAHFGNTAYVQQYLQGLEAAGLS